MGEIIDFKRDPGDDSVIAHLEELLAHARTGKITTIAYATVTNIGGIACGYSIGPDQAFEAVASVHRLIRRVEIFSFD